MEEKSIRESLSDGDRAKFEQGAELLGRLQEGKAFDDWVVIGQGLVPVRDAILKLFRLRKPRGRLYSETFSKACKKTPYAHLESDERANLLYCVDNLPTIERMRAEWSPAERANVCHPDSMRKRLREFEGDPQASNKEPRQSPMARLKEANLDLQERLDRAEKIIEQGGTMSGKDQRKHLGKHLADELIRMRVKRKKGLEALKIAAQQFAAHWDREDAKKEAEWNEQKTTTLGTVGEI